MKVIGIPSSNQLIGLHHNNIHIPYYFLIFMADLIKGKIYLGNIDDAKNTVWDGDIISVLQDLPYGVPKRAVWIPIIRSIGTINDLELIADQDVDVVALPVQLDLVARELQERYEKGTPTLIHCMGGMERSPLAVCYWLHKYHGMTWGEAYNFVKEKRPMIMNRYEWLNLSYDEIQS